MEAREREMAWRAVGDRAHVLELSNAGEWIEVKRSGAAAPEVWRVEGRLGDQHYKLGDAFATKEIAQGSALLLAMRLLPARRNALHAAIDAIPGVWWWKISPLDDETADHRAIMSSRASDSAADAERSGRAAGGGWWLFVYGPGTAHAFGRLPA
jgi:hypothetical protein